MRNCCARMLSLLFLIWALLFTPYTLNLAAQQVDEAAVQHYSKAAEEALSHRDAAAAIVALDASRKIAVNARIY